MAALAEAFVRVRADTSGVREDVRKDFEKTGGESGDAFGKRFSRDANDRLKGERGKFSTEGERLGEGIGDGANKGFAKKIGSSGGGFGGVLTKAFADIAPNIPNLVGGFGQVGDSVGDLAGRFGHLGITGASALTGLTSSLAKVGVGAAALSTLGAGAASAGASMVALTGAIVPVSGLFAALPGGILLGAAAMGTLKVALSGVGDAFTAVLSGDFLKFAEAAAELSGVANTVATELFNMAPALQAVKEQTQDAFFTPLVGQMASLLPVIDALRGGMSGLAGEFGLGALKLVEFARSAESIWAIKAVFDAMRTAVAEFTPSLQPLLAGFRDLGVVGAGWLADLVPGIAAAAKQFGWFMFNAAASGQALVWMDNALVVLKQLGSIAKDVGGIIGGIFDAAEKSGAGALGILGQLLDRFNTFINSAKGQQVLVTVFQSLHRVGQALGPVIEALAGALATIAPKIADIAVAFGPVLTSTISALAPAIAAMAPGIITMIDGIGAAVRTLGPKMVEIGKAIGGAFAALGPVFVSLGAAFALIAPQLAAVVVAFAPVVSTIINALAPALASLGPGLVIVGEELAKAFGNPAVREALLTLGEGIGNLLIAVAPLIPPLIELAAILVERLGAGLTLLAVFLKPVISALVEALAPILPQIASLLRDVSDALLPVARQFGGELATALRDLQPHIGPIMDALREVGGQILTAIRDVLPQVTPHLKDLAKAFGEVFVELVKILPDMIKFGGQILVEIIKQLPVLVPMVKDLALQFLGLFKELTPLLPKLTKLLMEIVLPLIPELPKLLPPLIDLVRVFTDLLKEATPMIDKLLESETVAAIVKIGAKNMVLAFELVKDAINFAVGAIQTFIGVFFGLPGQVDAGLGKMGNAIKGWVNSIIGWFEGVINILADVVPGAGKVTFPRFANGAIVDKATMAMIGEAGREVVIPLTRPARARQLADDSGLTAMLAGMRVPELSTGRRISSAGAAASGVSSDGPPWSDRPLIGTYVAAAGQTAQRLMSDLRVEAIGASW